MTRRLPLWRFLTIATFATAACNGKDVEEVCRPGSLHFTNVASLVASPVGVVADLRVAAIGSDFAVVWSSGASADDNDLYGKSVSRDGIVSSNEVRITQAAGISSKLRLAAGPSGLGVAWSDGRFAQRVAMGTVLSAGSLSPSGLPAVFQSPVVAADQLPTPGIAAIGESGWALAWNGRGSDANDHLFAQVLTSSGTAAGSPFALVPSQQDRATRPSVAVSSSGSVVIVDEELRVGAADADVWAYLVVGTSAASVRYGADSVAKSPEAVGFAGGAGVVWTDLRDGGRADLWYAAFGSGEIRLTEGPEVNGQHAVAPAGSGFLLTWIADGELRFRAMKGDGRPDGGVIAVGEGGTPDVAWNGFSAGVVWVDSSSRIWFRPLGCQ